MNKKGISPLISTVLLIGFAVALAAIVFTWGQSFTKETAERTQQSTRTALICSTELDFDISNVKCTSGVLENVQITNKGNIEIRALKFRVKNANGDVKIYDFNSVDDRLEPFGIKTYSTAFDVSDPEMVEAIAIIDIDNEDVVCSQRVVGSKIRCEDNAGIGG
jgi:flagellin-like protein